MQTQYSGNVRNDHENAFDKRITIFIVISADGRLYHIE